MRKIVNLKLLNETPVYNMYEFYVKKNDDDLFQDTTIGILKHDGNDILYLLGSDSYKFEFDIPLFQDFELKEFRKFFLDNEK